MNSLILLALAAGAALPVQAALNAKLGRALGNPMTAALASFITGIIAFLIYLVVTRTAFPATGTIMKVPPLLWLGGVLGGIYVAIAIVVTPRLGVAATMGLVIAGQFVLSMLLDHFGALGLDKHPVSPGRLLGAVLLAAGVVLIKRY